MTFNIILYDNFPEEKTLEKIFQSHGTMPILESPKFKKKKRPVIGFVVSQHKL